MSTILLVDDEQALLEVLSFVVRRIGHTPVLAHDGDEALAIARVHRPHVILSDYMMPRRNGLELCAAVRADPTLQSVPFLLMSAARPSPSEGCDLFIPKPFELERVADILRGYAASHGGAPPDDDGMVSARSLASWVETTIVAPLARAEKLGATMIASGQAADGGAASDAPPPGAPAAGDPLADGSMSTPARALLAEVRVAKDAASTLAVAARRGPLQGPPRLEYPDPAPPVPEARAGSVPGVSSRADVRATAPAEVGVPASGAPAGAATEGASPPSSAGSARTGRRLEGVKVLLVEDDLDGRELVMRVLARAGAHVDAAGSVEQALALFDKSAPHVLVSDITLPDGDGYGLVEEVAARAASAGRGLRALALTGLSRPGDKERGRQAGFSAHVTKPIDLSKLVDLVGKLSQDALETK